MEYLKIKIDELETKSNSKNITDLWRDINASEKGYQPRNDILKDEKSDLVRGCQSTVARWRKHLCQLLNIHGLNNVRQAEMQTADTLVPEFIAFEVEMAIKEIQRHKSSVIDQIPAELIKTRGRTIRCYVHKLINYIWNKDEWPEDWKKSIILPIYKKGDKRDHNNYKGISFLSTTYKILSNTLLSRLTAYAEEIIGDHQCGYRRNR
jgi:hypothetical protein